MSDILEILPFIIAIAFVVFGRLSKVKINEQQLENEQDQQEFEPLIIKERQPKVIYREQPEVTAKVDRVKTTNTKELDDDKTQQEPIDWKKAVIYSEILKPKFED